MSELPTSYQASPPLSVLPIGSPAPDFQYETGASGSLALSDLKGQTVVLVFSPPGWDPVRSEQIAEYNRVLRLVPDVQVELIDLSGDGRSAHLRVEDGEQVQMPLVGQLDSQSEIARAFGVHGKNALFVIDELGVIRWSYAAPAGIAPRADLLLDGLRDIAPGATPQPGEGCPVLSDAQEPQRATVSLSRRQFIAAALATAFVVALPHGRASGQGAGTFSKQEYANPGVPTTLPVTLRVNGVDHKLTLDPRTTLLDALREQIGLTGSKKGCDHGQCGACTVHLNGRRINSCLALAATCQGKEIQTIEGLANGETLDPMQEAFVRHDAFQCGYCTPGQIMSATAMLSEPWGPDDSEVREAMSGNICRCGAYVNIVDAVQEVRKAHAGGKSNASV